MCAASNVTKRGEKTVSLSFIRKKVQRLKPAEGTRLSKLSDNDKEEPMEVAQMPSSKNEDEVLLILSCKWLGPDRPQKPKMTLEKLLQSRFNKRKIMADCSVIKASGDERVLIKIKPAPALRELEALIGETLSKEGKTVTIMSVSLTPQNLKTQMPEDVSLDLIPSYGAPTEEGATVRDRKEEVCCICMDVFKNKKQLKCKHEFCEECLAQSKKSIGPICPICKDVFGKVEGDQPDGTMSWRSYPSSLPGFPGCGYIVINYNIPGGIQTKRHPKPGQQYQGINRTAYLPNNKEGNEVLHLLKKAFDQKLIFTVGTSRTTGAENVVTWNGIQHKTLMFGGPQSFGYPDPGYLSRVREELKAKGIE